MPSTYEDGYDDACSALTEENEAELTTLRAQLETAKEAKFQATAKAEMVIAILSRSDDEKASLRAQVEQLTRERDEARGHRDFWKKQLNIEAEISRRRTRERDKACRIADGYNKKRLAEREKVRRLVECVRKIEGTAIWQNQSVRNALATVSDITAPTDEVQ